MSKNESKCENCMEKKTKQEVQEMLKKYSADKDNLIRILEDVQEKFGYIPEVAQLEVANHLKMPLAEVYGVITFYSRFTTEPKGKYNVSICLGTACFVKGSEKLLDKAKQMLKIEEGQTTEDGKFTLEATRCLGACGLAPVMMINGEVYGRLTPDEIPGILAKYKTEA